MSENVVARLREEMNRCPKTDDRGVNIHWMELAALLDIAEAGAENEPLKPVVKWESLYPAACTGCGASGTWGEVPHDPNCPYLRAREICGMDGDE